MLIVPCNPEGIAKAVKTIENGGVVVFPTDTVYGIGCDPYNDKAVETVYKIKNREATKLVPVLANSKMELEKIAFFDEVSNKLAEKFWPGPLTLVLSLKDEKLKKSLHLENKVAIRIPNNDCILSILNQCKLLVGTSANFSGQKSFTDPKKCRTNFSGYDLFIDGGILPGIGESTIVEIEKEIKILREGIIPKEEILNIF